MPCMCGDFLCPSCGPAQGNTKCYVCGRWASEGGCEDPDKCNQEEIEIIAAEIALDKELEESAAQYWNDKRRDNSNI